MKREQHIGERALAGVSALIVFIALVLVAAIAAGVILDTAGFLQERAQTTGESSSDQISSTLDTISVVGVVENVSDANTTENFSEPYEYRITEVRIEVLKSPGAETINLNDSTVQVVQRQGSDTLTSGFPLTDANGNTVELNESDGNHINATPKFGLEKVQAQAFPLIRQPEDRYRYVIPFTGDMYDVSYNADNGAWEDPNATNWNTDWEEVGSLASLDSGQEVQITLVTGPGGQTLERFRTPSTLPEEDGATVVL